MLMDTVGGSIEDIILSPLQIEFIGLIYIITNTISNEVKLVLVETLD